MLNKIIWPVVGAAAGLLLAFVAAPIPSTVSECNVYKVSPKTVTSFVLKPPPSPVEHTACPVVQPPKCETPRVEEPVAEPVKEPRRRHRRVRRYWR